MPVLRSLSDLAVRRLFRSSRVEGVEDLVEGVRLVRLVGDDLRGVSWVPGQKVQLRTSGLTTRTFTPVAWDPEAGTTSFVAAMHGGGPGAGLVAAMRPAQDCALFGPRSSIDLPALVGPVLMVGDDTSVGLAVAARAVDELETRHLLETTRPDLTGRLVEALGVPATVVPRESEASVVPHVTDAIAQQPELTVVLTGRAQTIRAIRAAMKAAGVHRGRTVVRAYWDEKRSGLD